jgi:hypothetical protein
MQISPPVIKEFACIDEIFIKFYVSHFTWIMKGILRLLRTGPPPHYSRRDVLKPEPQIYAFADPTPYINPETQTPVCAPDPEVAYRM